ncbi:aldo/keto reductase [Demequina sp. SYSU T00192]|uniref:Aldo/keto reductase n=1 Tax=Demequina litoralis TaxID=3051660 RepID=A0ABT8GCW9_9MICO|nr:aldo/keto reductase [Demequina sp. SYSU T00192]MDN4476812.1 aldo/keto reductase [Demequina sp. SYSU T00192]
MILNETYTLSNGVEIPKLGLGTWFIDDADAAQAVRDAVEIGYRNIDTAQAYGNERGVGEGVRTASVPRSEIFVSTKLHAEIKTYDEAVAAIDGSLETMGLDYIDLFLIHAPQPWADFRGGDYTDGNRAAWKAMEEALAAGKVRAIGVSNFKNEDVDALVAGATVVPHVNQVLVHAGNTPQDILAYSAEKNIQIQGYSPMGHGEILGNETIGALAEKYGVSVPQLAIRYVIQLGTVALPKTANPEHMKANAQVDFEISDEDMKSLIELEAKDYGDVSFFPVYSGK